MTSVPTKPHIGGRFPLRLVTTALLTGVIVGLCVLIAVPFLHGITWGVALAIIGWPMHKFIRARLAKPTVAASLSTFIVIVLIVVPGIWVVYEIGRESTEIAAKLESSPDQLLSRKNLEALPGAGTIFALMDQVNLDVETEVRNLLTSMLPAPNGLALGSVAATVQFLVSMYILFYAFRDRGEFMQGLRDLIPLTREESDRVFASAADSVFANLYATVVTGLIDSVSGAVLFWYLGLPAPFVWGAVMFILSILPIVGAGMVWVPVAIYFAFTDQWSSALAIVVWGGFVAIAVDYILYAKLAGDRMRMHPVLALIAFLGGLAIFGLSGIILGPAIFAITIALLELWRARNEGVGSAMKDTV